jgi:hypothetical protein
MLVEWLHRGKPTALGFASGLVAGLVAVTPASGFVTPLGALVIGMLAGIVCYVAVSMKPFIKYDDSLDAFGVHGVGGFLGAVLTGFLAAEALYRAGSGSGLPPADFARPLVQLVAALVAVAYAFAVTWILVKAIDLTWGFCLDSKSENEGPEPRAARVPRSPGKRFSVVVDGVQNGELMHVWSDLCRPGDLPPEPEFKAVYPNVTTVQGNRFRFRGGDPQVMRDNLQHLFRKRMGAAPVRVHIEN